MVGPRAIPLGLPGAVVFSCQLPGAAPTCYSPSQILNAYNIQPLLDEGFTGQGKTIVIIDAFQSPTLVADLKVFISVFGLSSVNGLGGPTNSALPTFRQIAPGGLTPFDPNNQDQVGWSGEISLDVEWAHAIAPRANIVFVLAKSDADADILSVTKYAVDHRLGDVVSQSFGEDESCVDPTIAQRQHQVFIEATLKNMTIFASSGDFDAALPSCDGSSFVKGVSSPAGTPGPYKGETVWNDQFGASGGGYSVLYNKPFYQLLAVKGSKRGVPDVAYNADVATGVLVAWSQGVPANIGHIFLFGGTSAGSRNGLLSLRSLTSELASTSVLLTRACTVWDLTQSGNSASFHDITSGNNTFEGITGFRAGHGWDATTGLGSPKGIDFVDNLLKFVSPLDGLIGILESGPFSNGIRSHSGRQKPH